MCIKELNPFNPHFQRLSIETPAQNLVFEPLLLNFLETFCEDRFLQAGFIKNFTGLASPAELGHLAVPATLLADLRGQCVRVYNPSHSLEIPEKFQFIL